MLASIPPTQESVSRITCRQDAGGVAERSLRTRPASGDPMIPSSIRAAGSRPCRSIASALP
jgi:hypothetical protein